jgi:hypothetical protein
MTTSTTVLLDGQTIYDLLMKNRKDYLSYAEALAVLDYMENMPTLRLDVNFTAYGTMALENWHVRHLIDPSVPDGLRTTEEQVNVLCKRFDRLRHTPAAAAA